MPDGGAAGQPVTAPLLGPVQHVEVVEELEACPAVVGRSAASRPTARRAQVRWCWGGELPPRPTGRLRPAWGPGPAASVQVPGPTNGAQVPGPADGVQVPGPADGAQGPIPVAREVQDRRRAGGGAGQAALGALGRRQWRLPVGGSGAPTGR
jgi:hypothetical protein